MRACSDCMRAGGCALQPAVLLHPSPAAERTRRRMRRCVMHSCAHGRFRSMARIVRRQCGGPEQQRRQSDCVARHTTRRNRRSARPRDRIPHPALDPQARVWPLRAAGGCAHDASERRRGTKPEAAKQTSRAKPKAKASRFQKNFGRENVTTTKTHPN